MFVMGLSRIGTSERASGILDRILEEFQLSNRCSVLKSSSSVMASLEGGYPCSSTKPTKAHNLLDKVGFNNTLVATRSSISVLQTLGELFVFKAL